MGPLSEVAGRSILNSVTARSFFCQNLNKNTALRHGSSGTRLQRHYIETGLGSDK